VRYAPLMGARCEFYTVPLPEHRCIRLMVKNLGKQMPESVVREALGALGIHVQGVLQLRSGRREQDEARNRPLTPHFIVSVVWGVEVQKVRSSTEVCGFRVSVETYMAPKDPLQCKPCQRFGHMQGNCGYPSRCVTCGEVNLSGKCSTPKNQLKCCNCGVSTHPVIGAVQSGTKPRRGLRSQCRPSAGKRTVQLADQQHRNLRRRVHRRNRRA
jgi:hypothetical protein